MNILAISRGIRPSNKNLSLVIKNTTIRIKGEISRISFSNYDLLISMSILRNSTVTVQGHLIGTSSERDVLLSCIFSFNSIISIITD